MKQFILPLLTVLLTAAGCSKDILKGEGPVLTETVPVTGFNKITVNGATKLFITRGANFSVEKKGYANLLPYLDFSVSANGTLTIGFKDVYSVRRDNTEAWITMPELIGLAINGSNTILVNSGFASQKIDCLINGSGLIDFSSGNADTLNSTINGNGTIRAFLLSSAVSVPKIYGNGQIETHAAHELHASISGNGKIYYRGNPAVVNSNISGNGKVIKQ